MSDDDLESQARSIYPNQGMHRNAAFLAGLHPRAIDYLRQAPVLAASFGVKANSRADRLYIATRIGGPIERGERLRSVMSSVGLATPLRKLTGYAVVPFVSSFVRELADLDASTLAQSIPDKPRAQRQWLASLRDYRSRMRLRWRSPKLGFSWVARHAHQCEDGQAADFADFICSNPAADFERWSLERMANEVELWHDRLNAETAVQKFGTFITSATVIDHSDWPDHAEVGGFEFFKLTTPAMLLEEGRRMRHCVASYVPIVMSGKSSIFSIRSDFRRMATLQISGPYITQIKGFGNKLPHAAVRDAADQFLANPHPKGDGV